MKRKTFDALLSAGGAVLAIVLLVAGALLMVAANFANNNVRSQLADQQIYFPPAAAFAHAKAGTEITPEMRPYLLKYAGQQVLTGSQAEAYADHFIKYHLEEMPYGGVYATISAKAMADPKNAQLQALVQTSFKGTTLRGLLLEAYAFGTFGQIAMWGGIASFILAGVMLILTALGFRHLRKASPVEEL
jgi:hypothetical protein